MAVIKLDKDKADSLIRDLNRISSDIEKCLKKINNTTANREISLYDSRLKVYEYRAAIKSDESEKIKRVPNERFLKYDYTSNARAYNKYVRLLNNNSVKMKNNAISKINSVVDSLSKIKTAIEEFESDQDLKLVNNLGDVGYFDFNFLSAYGAVSSNQVQQSPLGALVVDEEFTSSFLGILAANPTMLDQDKLKTFDELYNVVQDDSTDVEEKKSIIKGLIGSLIPTVNDENVNNLSEQALNNMYGIIDSDSLVVDDYIKVQYLDKLGINPVDVASSTVAAGAAVVGALVGSGQEIIPNVVEQETISPTVAATLGVAAAITRLEDLDGSSGSGDGSELIGELVAVPQEPNSSNNTDNVLDNLESAREKVDISKINVKDYYYKKREKLGIPNGNNDVGGDVTVDAASEENNNIADNSDKVVTNVIHSEFSYKPDTFLSAGPGKVLGSDSLVEDESVILDAEDVALNEELQNNSIVLTSPVESDESSDNVESPIVENETSEVVVAGAGVGAVGLGILGNIGGGGANNDVPVINGMVAEEIIGGNVYSDVVPSLPSSNSGGSSAASDSNIPKIVHNNSHGGEATSDSGTVKSSVSSDVKAGSNITSSKGGTTLEDKDNNKNENTYGKPNTTEEVEEKDKKGMLGDAAIAELNLKDEKNIKIATGVTAGTILASGIAALVNFLPWLMFALAILAMIVYVGYRIKKKKDKKKRMELLAARKKKEREERNNSEKIEIIQNVNESTNSSSDADANETNENEFSNQPYEPSRDGDSEIRIEKVE